MRKCKECGKEMDNPLLLICPACASKHIEENIEGNDFVKADDGKLQWDLMPFEQLEPVVRILMFGCKKYSKNNWQKCNNPVRYQNAAMRHLTAYMKGEKIDPESKESHLAHLICNALFLMWFDKRDCND